MTTEEVIRAIANLRRLVNEMKEVARALKGVQVKVWVRYDDPSNSISTLQIIWETGTEIK